jgi:sugar O-acyltransferase (sialic acid O-acetyltransferase NeuD family)
MKEKILIYGDTDFAGQVMYSIENDSKYEVEAFTVHKEYRKSRLLYNLPVFDFEDIVMKYKPDEYKMFVAIGYKKMNTIREKIINLVRKSGYELINYISSSSICKTKNLGVNIYIDDLCGIGEGAVIGDGCIFNMGAMIGHRCQIGNNVFFAGSVSLAGDIVIEDNCYIGNNTTIANGLIVKKQTFLGAATYLNKSTEPNLVYSGNPAKKYNMDSLIITEEFL